MSQDKYEVIIIGSGIGALGTASLLAQQKKRKILILEQHFKAGGFTHIFRRKQKYLFDVGLHYLGDLQEGSFLKKLFHFVSRGGLKFQKMPHIFEKFVYPDLTFSQKNSFEEFTQDLIDLFPHEKTAIKQYFSEIKKASEWFTLKAIKDSHFYPNFFRPLFDIVYSWKKNWSILTTQEVLDSYFKHPKLKAILASQWGDYGLPPAQSSFVAHALVVKHYLEGGWYPVGGSGKLFQSIKPILDETQSQVLLNHRVKRILVENNVAKGVLAEVKREDGQGKEEKIFYADKIISNVGAYNTYLNLLDEGLLGDIKIKLSNFIKRNPALSTVVLFIGLKEDPRKLGFFGENHWIFQSYNHNENYARASDYLNGESDPTIVYLSFPSLKDPDAESHTAEIITFAPYQFFEKWREEPWKKRGADYQEIKEKISQKLIQFIDRKYPGFQNLVDFYELATPITIEYFSLHHQGAMYGLPVVPERFDREKSPFTQIETPIKNLYLTGSDTLFPGIGGSLLSSLFTFAAVEGYEAFLQLLIKLL